MKTIVKSVLWLATLAILVVGCQKESEDINVSLKSSDVTYISPWNPAGGSVAECALAGGCNGGSIKFDGGVKTGSTYSGMGLVVTGISSKSFTWTSELYPVCKIIVKAGTGAYIIPVDNATEGMINLFDYVEKPKDISHITFCFGQSVIAIKSWYYTPEGSYVWATSSGTSAFPSSVEWCHWLGYNPYPGTTTFNMNAGYSNTKVGEVTVSTNGDVSVTMNGMLIDVTYVYIGTLEGLQVPINGCPSYTVAPWISNNVDGLVQNFNF